MEEDYGITRYFETDTGECSDCGCPTHNACGDRIKCDCDYNRKSIYDYDYDFDF